MADNTIAAPENQRSVGDIADDIDCSIGILRDLMRLAIQECQKTPLAEAAIRAANRYVDDIAKLNQGLHNRQMALKGGA